jgi:hypothetical protein
MIRNLGPKMAGILLVLMSLCGLANADPVDLQLVIRDTVTNQEITVTDCFGTSEPGAVCFEDEFGSYYITLTFGITEEAPGSTRLALLSHVDYTDANDNPLPQGQLVMTLTASGYTLPASVVTFLGTVGGWGFDENGMPVETGSGQIANGSGTFQTSINGVGAFGPDGYTATGVLLLPPTGGYLTPVQPYTVVSTATLNFNGGPSGNADFSLVGTVSAGQIGDPLQAEKVPEPLSLLLLGSGLIGLGVLRFRKRH